MGHEIEKVLSERGHSIPIIIDQENQSQLDHIENFKLDSIIEFSTPESAFDNLKICLEKQIPVVSGTTGWLERKDELVNLCNKLNGTFFYASNYSLGVNLFFKLNQWLAKTMKGQNYQTELSEIHHTKKVDKPSGTAISLAEDILQENKSYSSWVLDAEESQSDLVIKSFREADVPGTHTVSYLSDTDEIEIKHLAKSRKGFALGAVLVAEWIANKKGVLSMDDFLNFN